MNLYEKYDGRLTGRNYLSRKVANNTYMVRSGRNADEDYIAIQLHWTHVVRFYRNGIVEINSGGWETVTTKARINDWIYETGYQIRSKRGIWYLCRVRDFGVPKDAIRFVDGMTINDRQVFWHEPDQLTIHI